MRILALITARGGSKRLPGKNIRPLAGKPMIVWSIDVVRGIPEVCDILVSTDDSAAADIGRSAGALVPWLRPAELATDTAASVDVAIHALDWYEESRGAVDGLLLLQPTSPFRARSTVLSGIVLFEKNGRLPVIGVSPSHAHPMWTFRMEGHCLVPFLQDHGFGKRSQDLPAAYVWNGSFFLISPEHLRANRSFVGEKSIPLLMESDQEVLDIDSEWDFQLAESIAAKIHGS